MAASKTIGGINVTITATIDKFRKTMTAAQRILGSFTKSIKNAIFSLKGLAVALALGAFTKMTANAFQAIDAMGDLADKLGVSTEKLYGLQLAASEASISSETLERAMVALNKKGMGGITGLREWIEKTGKLSTHQEKLAAATEMFGSRGSSMVRMLTGGTAALDDAQAAAERLGWSLSRSAVAGVDRAMDALGRLRAALGGLFANLAIEIAPYLEALTGKLTDVLTAKGGVSRMGKGIADAIIRMTKLVADGIQSMVQGVLSIVAEIKQVIFSARTSQAMFKWMPGGLYKNAAEREQARAGIASSRASAARFGGAPWSATIEGWANSARAAAAQQAANAPAVQGDLLKRIGKNLADSLRKGVTDRVRNLDSWQTRLMAKIFAFGATHAGVPSMREGMTTGGGLAAQDPLSREGFSQRVRSLAQNQLLKVNQQQLAEQRGIRAGIDRLAQGNVAFAPLNL